jgi:hypothetical protein
MQGTNVLPIYTLDESSHSRINPIYYYHHLHRRHARSLCWIAWLAGRRLVLGNVANAHLRGNDPVDFDPRMTQKTQSEHTRRLNRLFTVCKALSTAVEPILHQVQSPVNTC